LTTVLEEKTTISAHLANNQLQKFVTEWAIPFNIRTPPVEEQWNSSGVRDKSGVILQG